MIDKDKCTNNQLSKDYIRFKLDTASPVDLSSIASSNYRIATGSIAPEGSVTYTLYVWIKDGVGNDVLNRHYHGKIVVNGVNSSSDATSSLSTTNLEDNTNTIEEEQDSTNSIDNQDIQQ